MTANDLAQAESTAIAAKSAYAANPTSDNYAAHRAAQTALREARWRARGGLDNPYGARSYADLLNAQREQRATGREVTYEYGSDGTVTMLYGEWVFTADGMHDGEDEQ